MLSRMSRALGGTGEFHVSVTRVMSCRMSCVQVLGQTGDAGLIEILKAIYYEVILWGNFCVVK